MLDRIHHSLDEMTVKAYLAWIAGLSSSGWLSYLISDRGLQKFILIFSALGLFLGVIAGALKVINEWRRLKDG